MPRKPARERSVEPIPVAYVATPLPPCRVSREFAEELGLDPFTSDPPAPLGGVVEARLDSTSAPRSVALPTLPPEAVAPPRRGATRAGKVSLLVTALCVVAYFGYAMGHDDGRIEGELHQTQAQVTAIAEAAAASRAPATATAPALPAAASTSVAPGPLPLPLVAPTSVQSTVGEGVEPRDSSLRTRAADEARDRRRRSGAGVEDRDRSPGAESRAAADDEPVTTPTVATDQAAQATNDGSLAESTDGATEAVAVVEPSSGQRATEVRPAPRAPLDPLAGAIGPELAARLGLTHSPMELEVQEIAELPERPSQREVGAAIHRILPRARDCGHEGTLRVAMLVRPDGHVVDARIDEGEPTPEVAECVVSTLKDARFAPFRGPELVVSYPVRL